MFKTMQYNSINECIHVKYTFVGSNPCIGLIPELRVIHHFCRLTLGPFYLLPFQHITELMFFENTAGEMCTQRLHLCQWNLRDSPMGWRRRYF